MSRASIWTIARFPPLPAAFRFGVFPLTCRFVPEGFADGQTQKDCRDEFDTD
jgi:hypothetical protein